MRWHTKQQKQQREPLAQQEQLVGAPAAGTGGQSDKAVGGDDKATRVGGETADALMDPTLIGDAIEIFLRAAMEQQQQQQQRHEAPSEQKEAREEEQVEVAPVDASGAQVSAPQEPIG